MGSNGTTNYTTVQATSGAENITLNVSQIPEHNHGVNVNSSTNANRWADVVQYHSWSTNHAPSGQHGNTGGGGSHNNMQPYITCYMWRRTA